MDHETQTPFLAWGAGLRNPELGISSWPNFSSKRSCNLNQTDVAPLMASLIGANFPQHSVGKIPLDFLDIHDLYKVDAKVANALQIHEQYLSFKTQRTDALFPNILPRTDPFQLHLKEHLEKIELLKSKTNYKGNFEPNFSIPGKLWGFISYIKLTQAFWQAK